VLRYLVESESSLFLMCHECGTDGTSKTKRRNEREAKEKKEAEDRARAMREREVCSLFPFLCHAWELKSKS